MRIARMPAHARAAMRAFITQSKRTAPWPCWMFSRVWARALISYRAESSRACWRRADAPVRSCSQALANKGMRYAPRCARRCSVLMLNPRRNCIAFDEARAAARITAALSHLTLVGLACHIGSQITATAPYLDALDKMLALI